MLSSGAGQRRPLSIFKASISMYDLLMRLPFSAWVLASTGMQATRLVQYVRMAPTVDSVYVIHIATWLSIIAFLLLLAAAALSRTRPSAKASGLEPRISALAGSFLMSGVGLFPRQDLSPSAELIATLLMMIGSAGAVIALSQLGRSFSLMAETRQIVNSGPYRFVRHPLYVAEEIAMIGLFVQFASMWTALLLAMQIAFQLRRIHNEEAGLSSRLPQDNGYA